MSGLSIEVEREFKDEKREYAKKVIRGYLGQIEENRRKVNAAQEELKRVQDHYNALADMSVDDICREYPDLRNGGLISVKVSA